MINNEKVDLCENYKIKEDEKSEITLVKEKPIIEISGMLYNCESLSYIKVNRKCEMDNVTEMYSMFYGCEALNDIGDLFKYCNRYIESYWF